MDRKFRKVRFRRELGNRTAVILLSNGKEGNSNYLVDLLVVGSCWTCWFCPKEQQYENGLKRWARHRRKRGRVTATTGGRITASL
jgi:hypothetical protein